MPHISSAEKQLRYYLVDFEEGPQIIPANWLAEDKRTCAWPLWANDLDQNAWDKAVREPIEPEADWTEADVLRIRIKDANFPYARSKLRAAEDVSGTDLQSDDSRNGPNRALRKRKPNVDEDESFVPKLPKFPPVKSSLSLDKENNDPLNNSIESTASELDDLFGAHKTSLTHPLSPLPGSQWDNDDLSSSPESSDGDPSNAPSTPSSSCSGVPSGSQSSPSNSILRTTRNSSKVSVVPSSHPPSESGTCNVPAKGQDRRAGPKTPSSRSPSSSECSNGDASNIPLPPLSSGSGVPSWSQSSPSNSILRTTGNSSNVSAVPSSHPPSESGTCNIPAKGQDRRAGPKTPSSRCPSSSGNEPASNYTPSIKERTMAMAEGMSDVEFKSYLISALCHMKLKLNLLSARSVGMAEDTSSGDDVSSDNSVTHIMYGLPADNSTEWANFEGKLQDKTFTAALVKELKRCKDDSFAGTVRNILGSVLSNKIASEFSMCGSHGRKRSFKETTFYKTALPGVMKKLYQNFTDKELKEATENWLRLAAQRSGGSKFKKYKKKVTIVAEGNLNEFDDSN